MILTGRPDGATAPLSGPANLLVVRPTAENHYKLAIPCDRVEIPHHEFSRRSAVGDARLSPRGVAHEAELPPG
jgi:hypothetical protein